jgi:uncharacterized protein YdeI (YjbR/CyaY-like superfamily)
VSGAADYPRVHPKTAAEWRRWLRDNHAKAPGVWLVSYKRATGKPFVEYEDLVLEALCFGWIDGQLRPIDDERSSLLFAPRKSGSGWARTNKERVRRLIAEGRMQPAGLAKIEAAKKDGSWALLDSVEALEVPADLKKALGAASAKRFDGLSPSLRKQHLYSLVTAKRPETRAKRVADIVRSLR